MDTLTKFTEILVWPATLISIVLIFRRSLVTLFNRASTISFEIAGNKIALERRIEKETVEKVENAISRLPETSSKAELMRSVQGALRDVLDENVDEQDVCILLAIKTEKEVSRRKLEDIMGEYGMRPGLGGALTGLQHQGYICGWFERQNMRLTEKGERFINGQKIPKSVLRFFEK